MTAEEYFYNHWQKANRGKFGDYDSDEYATAFANDYAALRINDVVGRSEQLLDFIQWRKQVAVDDLTDKEIVEFYLAGKIK